MTNSEIDKLIEEKIRRACAFAWERGFSDGELYGIDYERHNPDWDYYEPSKPENPYK